MGKKVKNYKQLLLPEIDVFLDLVLTHRQVDCYLLLYIELMGKKSFNQDKNFKIIFL
jgi:hypothetical protein